MYYKSKALPKKIQSKVARRKSVRYHNDAALFPDDGQATDRKRKKAIKKRANYL